MSYMGQSARPSHSGLSVRTVELPPNTVLPHGGEKGSGEHGLEELTREALRRLQ
jgi:hypothetical protein